MNLTDLRKYAENPSSISMNGVKELEELVRDYPYFSTAHILLAKGMYNNNSIRYAGQLKLAACYIGERSVLFSIIKSNQVEKNEFSPAIEIVSENITEQVEPDSKIQNPVVELNSDNKESTIINAGNQTYQVFDDLLEFDYSDSLKFEAKPIKEIKFPISGGSGDYFASQIGSSNSMQTKEILQTPLDKNSLIDKFLEKNPRIIPKNEVVIDDEMNDISENSVEEKEYLSETLAKIYLKQRNYDKAMKIYQKLSLKYPQKSIYFADQILMIKNLKHNQ